MEPWWLSLLEFLILLPLKIIELVLNIFAFIIWTIASPFIKIVTIIKGDNGKCHKENDKRTIQRRFNSGPRKRDI